MGCLAFSSYIWPLKLCRWSWCWKGPEVTGSVGWELSGSKSWRPQKSPRWPGVTAARCSQNPSHSPAEGFSNQESPLNCASSVSAVSVLPSIPNHARFKAKTGSSGFQVVVQSLSHVRLFVTPWTAAHQGSQSFTNSQRLLKLMSSPSCPLSPPPPAFNLSQPQGVFQKLVLQVSE